MKQKISGFHLDQENHWVADLNCGHAQHVRHDPPWTERDWVITKAGRDSRLDTELNCVRCDEAGNAVARAVLKECRESLLAAYESGGMSGLCAEGRWELALDSLTQINIAAILEKSLRQES
ncbi:MAG: DUF3565 domain-containing protein [Bdellovibrionota bacterium]